MYWMVEVFIRAVDEVIHWNYRKTVVNIERTVYPVDTLVRVNSRVEKWKYYVVYVRTESCGEAILALGAPDLSILKRSFQLVGQTDLLPYKLKEQKLVPYNCRSVNLDLSNSYNYDDLTEESSNARKYE